MEYIHALAPVFLGIVIMVFGFVFEFFMIGSLEYQLATNNVANRDSIVQQFRGSLSLDAFFISVLVFFFNFVIAWAIYPVSQIWIRISLGLFEALMTSTLALQIAYLLFTYVPSDLAVNVWRGWFIESWLKWEQVALSVVTLILFVLGFWAASIDQTAADGSRSKRDGVADWVNFILVERANFDRDMLAQRKEFDKEKLAQQEAFDKELIERRDHIVKKVVSEQQELSRKMASLQSEGAKETVEVEGLTQEVQRILNTMARLQTALEMLIPRSLIGKDGSQPAVGACKPGLHLVAASWNYRRGAWTPPRCVRR
jgi:hypothetical protein